MMESESSTRAASLGSAVAGIACATGWYLFIGAALEAGNRVNVAAGLTSGAYWAPGIIGTVGLAMLNAVNWESVTDDGGLSGDGSSTKAKVWVTLSLVVMFSALGGALWIFVQERALACLCCLRLR